MMKPLLSFALLLWLLFLCLACESDSEDVPPASPDNAYALGKSQLRTLIPLASQQGIRIVPISASGIDKLTEFLLRSMAILT